MHLTFTKFRNAGILISVMLLSHNPIPYQARLQVIQLVISIKSFEPCLKEIQKVNYLCATSVSNRTILALFLQMNARAILRGLWNLDSFRNTRLRCWGERTRTWMLTISGNLWWRELRVTIGQIDPKKHVSWTTSWLGKWSVIFIPRFRRPERLGPRIAYGNIWNWNVLANWNIVTNSIRKYWGPLVSGARSCYISTRIWYCATIMLRKVIMHWKTWFILQSH